MRTLIACLAPLSASAQAASLDTAPLPADSAATFAAPLATSDAGEARAGAASAAVAPLPTFAFFYGAHVPVVALSSFDSVVVEPDSDFDPGTADTSHTTWLAYVSVGEVTTARRYFKDIPKAWLRGENRAWGSAVVDQAMPTWPAFYVEHVIAPLWARGFRGFFLDTLDSYQIIAKTDAERSRQQAGVVAVIDAIKARFPSARLILNRGFELLPRVHASVYAVAFESLYRGWNQAHQRYTEVTPADRAWLMLQVGAAKAYGLPVVSIDYCPPADDACARDTAARIRAAGVIPYVTGPALDVVGVGAFAHELLASALAAREAMRAERGDAPPVAGAGAAAAHAHRETTGRPGAPAVGPVQFVDMGARRAI
ncbi:endo alpha-1,4 polygalactosaminidase [Burkholderia sp. F1]|uniref:endo alpha-1,4 polygalactosaminidase n=1 Tax=Burkholderia sp. F1 TaxID=3366817 RepID=UPI003D76368E